MKRIDRWMVVLLAIALMQMAACGDDSGTSSAEEAARLQEIDGSDLSLVILSSSASTRLAIETGTVRTEDLARTRQVGAQVIDKPGSAIQSDNEFWVKVILTAFSLSAG